jgi:hypothetical protein
MGLGEIRSCIAIKEKIGDYFQSRFLKADEFQGKEIPATISSIEEQRIGDTLKLVVYFHELKKPLVLNKTNALKIAKIAGTQEISKWKGTSLVLSTAKVTFKDEEVDAIRVKSA